MHNQPLKDIKVIELAGIGPTPYAGQLLADLGAEVIHIERPGAFKLPVENRGKIGIELDLKTDTGRNTVLEMLPTAHIVFEGNRPGVMEKLGLGPKDCHDINPALIYGRMTGWGQSGPWARTKPATTSIISALQARYMQWGIMIAHPHYL